MSYCHWLYGLGTYSIVKYYSRTRSSPPIRTNYWLSKIAALCITTTWARFNYKMRSVVGLVMQASGSLVEVDILELSWSMLVFSTPAWDWGGGGEGIRPGNGWEAINWISTRWEIMGRGSPVQISVSYGPKTECYCYRPIPVRGIRSKVPTCLVQFFFQNNENSVNCNFVR